MTTQTVLIVEDEQDIRDLLAFNCRAEGFDVLSSGDGNQALALIRDKLPDVILLDLMLPGLDGLSICRNLQRDPATANIPIIMLTAKGEEIDRIVGFELGASDYVVKPFSPREVMLRIKAVLKRRGQGPGNTEPGNVSLACGQVRLDPARHTVFVADAPIALTLTEFRLLEDLLRHAGQARTREQLLDAVWGYSFEGYARTVDTHVRRLRAKLGVAEEIIETIRGIGYRVTEQDHE